MKSHCDCIIPFYNEGARPLSVVQTLHESRLFSKIIVVDDGSEDRNTYLKLKKQFPNVIAIRLQKNSGKAKAIKEGLKRATSEYIALVDGDLSNVQPDEIENALRKITHNPDIDMIILSVVTDLMKKDLFRWYTILSGQRILRKSDLINIYRNPFSGFQLEAAINDYMIKNNKKSYWVGSSIQNISKYRKWGKIEGIKRVFSLIKDFSDYTGWWGLIYQTLFFCRKEADCVV